MGLTVTTDKSTVVVIRKDGTNKAGNPYTMYSLMYSFKNANDVWKNVFVDAQFRKGTDLANKSKINITNAFMTGSEYNGNTKPKIFVLDYEVVECGHPAPALSGDESWASIPDGIVDELPFN